MLTPVLPVYHDEEDTASYVCLALPCVILASYTAQSPDQILRTFSSFQLFGKILSALALHSAY